MEIQNYSFFEITQNFNPSKITPHTVYQAAIDGTSGDNGPLEDGKAACGIDKDTVATYFYWSKLQLNFLPITKIINIKICTIIHMVYTLYYTHYINQFAHLKHRL